IRQGRGLTPAAFAPRAAPRPAPAPRAPPPRAPPPRAPPPRAPPPRARLPSLDTRVRDLRQRLEAGGPRTLPRAKRHLRSCRTPPGASDFSWAYKRRLPPPVGRVYHSEHSRRTASAKSRRL